MSEGQANTTNASNQQNAEKKQRSTRFRVQEEKRIEINKTHSNPRNKAEVLKIITIGLFGARRYKNIVLTASLNNFYNALMIANLLQKRVEKLALIIKLEKISYTEFADQGAEGQKKQYSIFVIKLTRNPSQQEKKSEGYNPGSDKIQNPLTEIWKNRRGSNNNRPRRFNNRGGRGGRRIGGGDRRNRDYNNERNERSDRRDREDRGERRYRQDRGNDGGRFQRRRQERDDREDRRQPQRQDRNRGDNRYPQNDKRGGYSNNNRYDDRPRQTQNNERRYRQDKNERIEDDNQYHRGQRKTRGTKYVSHEYNKDHINRDRNENNRKQDRGQRDPRKNRYSSDED